ncbi:MULTISPECIES: alpha/beta hydrolase [unclassified Variovorax]|uniref:alpha/beta hydrolase n=1 Tax=unclassified Variovorax TaxID=663243 RepID=UPI001316498C|nr:MULTISPECIES: alpha/beta fold hydrolase [unclassified Variovorax]VTU23174.1 acetoin dehydrogenase E2 subunit dihydrolipoyllysine-residue acetyltransferase [Variovorax sp. SRS16]VTU31389.1 acetoin dehydrogenase E2 subunit dihydrolipoyllysine-residue acetyltransferase [Variovorax sp. PBL-E5]
MKSWSLFASAITLVTLLAGGCASLDEHQREWIFQPSDRSWGNSKAMAEGMQDEWIDFKSSLTGEPVRLHGLWLGDKPESADTPVLLFLHGAKYNVAGSAPRMRRMHELGFSVLAIDYRGFGKSTKTLPSEDSAREDALAAWTWLAARHPQQRRYIFGHSLGGAIGIDLASRVNDESGTIVESTFTSIADVVSSFKWGWLPFRPFITQRFDAIDKVKDIGAPLLVVHGTADALINPTLGRKLYDAATVPKMFVLVQGGSHYDANSIGQAQYRAALSQLFRMKEPPDATAASEPPAASSLPAPSRTAARPSAPQPI